MTFIPCFSNKRKRFVDENTDPSTSEAAYVCAASATSPIKSSPISSVVLGDMGLGILDSDESNQSSIIGQALSTITQPSSTLSMMPSENSNDFLYANSEIESNCGTASKTFPNEAITTSDTKSDMLAGDIIMGSGDESQAAASSSNHQDNTPSNLISLSRTSFRGVLDAVAQTSTATCTQQTNLFTVPDSPPVNIQLEGGRTIRGASMKKHGRHGIDTEKLPRSPLAAIGNAMPTKDNEATKTNSTSADDEFFMYQKRDPRLYTGEDNFAQLSDEVLLSIFKWLPKKALIRCSTVNRRFNRVTQDESLWTRLDMAARTIQARTLYRVLSSGVIILRLAQCKVCINGSFKVCYIERIITFFNIFIAIGRFWNRFSIKL